MKIPGSSTFKFILAVLLILIGLLGYGCQSKSTDPPTQNEIWHVYTQTNSALVNNHINGITVDFSGKMWFATNNGAAYLSNNSWGIFQDSLKSPANNKVNYIVEAKDHAIWFCLNGGGVVRFSPFSARGVWHRYGPPDVINDVVLSAAANRSDETTYGELWFVTSFGITYFLQNDRETGSWTSYNQSSVSQLATNQYWTAATKPDDNSIWFGGQTGGPVKVQFGVTTFDWARYPFATNDAKITSIGFDLGQNIWIAKEVGAASFSLTSGNWTEYTRTTTHGNLPEGQINALLTNLQQTRWFGTDSGLIRFDDTTWTKFSTSNSPLPNDTITALRYDLRGNLWIGTPSGVAVYNKDGIRD